MKLRNKKTGEILDFDRITDTEFGHKILLQATEHHDKPIYVYNSLAELNAVWEDYEESKPWWYIDISLDVKQGELFLRKHAELFKNAGNYFNTREEAEKAVEKLEAYKRLKEKGFRFEGWTVDDGLRISICTNIDSVSKYDEYRKQVNKDLDICFGGEE